MPISINGTSGISGVDGSAGTPALQGTDTNTGIAFGSDVIIGSTGGTERFRCDSGGRMLVGTSSGTGGREKLQVMGHASDATASGEITLAKGSSVSSGDLIGLINFTSSTNQSFATIGAFADATTGTNDYPGRLVFSTTADGASSPTERMRISNGGNVLFNCTSEPSASVFGAAVIDNGSSGRQYRSSVNTTSGYNHCAFLNTNGVIGTITTTGSATAYNTSSDYRLKENVTAVTDGITRLQQLKPSRFNFIADPDKTVDGFIAHEVQNVVPEAITGEKDAIDEDGNPIYQGIDQSKLVPLLTAALQEAIAKIESLETRLAALEVTP